MDKAEAAVKYTQLYSTITDALERFAALIEAPYSNLTTSDLTDFGELPDLLITIQSVTELLREISPYSEDTIAAYDAAHSALEIAERAKAPFEITDSGEIRSRLSSVISALGFIEDGQLPLRVKRDLYPRIADVNVTLVRGLLERVATFREPQSKAMHQMQAAQADAMLRAQGDGGIVPPSGR